MVFLMGPLYCLRSHTVEVRHLIEHVVQTDFGAHAVVAKDIKDQRVRELGHTRNGVDENADLYVPKVLAIIAPLSRIAGRRTSGLLI